MKKGFRCFLIIAAMLAGILQYTYAEEKVVSSAFSTSQIIVKHTPKSMGFMAMSAGFYGIPAEVLKLADFEEPSPGFRSYSIAPAPELLLLKMNEMEEEELLSIISYLNSLPEIEYAEPDYIVTASAMANDPKNGYLYGLNQIKAPLAWDTETGSNEVLVGVIDTGIDINHEDLYGNIWTNPNETENGGDDDNNGYADDLHGWNFVNDNNNIFDDNGHGTHVSGTIGAMGNNGIGISGVAWNVKLVGLKVLNERGSGTTSNIIRAIRYAKDNNIHITNNSYGNSEFSQALYDVIENNGLFVAAAGNDSRNNDVIASYPASFQLDNIISVASVDEGENLSYFSNFGSNTVHIAAPGSNIYSTLPNNNYGSYSGTSMATPHVAGAAALVLSAHPEYTTAELKNALLYSVNKQPQFKSLVAYGGILNVSTAIGTINYIDAANISVSDSSITLMLNEISRLSAEIQPADITDPRIIWESDNPAVAVVNPRGKITPVSQGTCTITATSRSTPSVSDSCIVAVSGTLSPISFTDNNFKEGILRALSSLEGTDPEGEDINYYKQYTLSSPLYPKDVERITALSISGLGISNLSGIEYFKNLTTLKCGQNNLISLDIDMLSNLKVLDASGNNLTYFNFNEQNSWQQLSIHNNILDIAPILTRLETAAVAGAAVRYLPQRVNIPVTGITAAESSISLDLRETRLLSVSVLPENASNKGLAYTSSNTSAVSVTDTGFMVALSTGNSNITITSMDNPSYTETINVTVSGSTVSPIDFADIEFKKVIVQQLKGTYRPPYNNVNFTEASDIYPSDMAEITYFYVYGNAAFQPIEMYMLGNVKTLNISNTPLASIDISACKQLTNVVLSNCGLSEINVSGLQKLERLNVTSNNLSEIDISGLGKLTALVAENNLLTSVNLQGAPLLDELDISHNLLTEIDFGVSTGYTNIKCGSNRLKSLDLRDFSYLTRLECNDNSLTSLTLNPHTIWYMLICYNNYLDVLSGSPFMQDLGIILENANPIGTIAYFPQLPAPPFMHLSFINSFVELQINEELTVTPENNAGLTDIMWASDNPAAVSVDSNGKITSIEKGLAVITAYSAENPHVSASYIAISVDAFLGEGTALDPFIIGNAEELGLLSSLTTGSDKAVCNKYLTKAYKLIPENGEFIDMTRVAFNPVGFGVSPFSGNFDGNNKEIKGLTIKKAFITYQTNSYYGVGLFTSLDNAEIKDLSITNADISLSANDYYTAGAGILSGNANHTRISNVDVSGRVISAGGNDNYTGGLTGRLSGYSSAVTDCRAEVTASADNYAGGMFGSIESGTINTCFSNSNVTGSFRTGGFSGDNSGDIINCGSVGIVVGDEHSGGFLGLMASGSIRNSFSGSFVSGTMNTGGFFGNYSTGTTENCYSYGEVTGQTSTGGFTGFLNGRGSTEFCYSISNVTGNTNVGGFVGLASYSRISSCYAGGNVIGQSYTADFVGRDNGGIDTYSNYVLSKGGGSAFVQVNKNDFINEILVGNMLNYGNGYIVRTDGFYPQIKDVSTGKILRSQPRLPLSDEIRVVFEKNGMMIGQSDPVTPENAEIYIVFGEGHDMYIGWYDDDNRLISLEKPVKNPHDENEYMLKLNLPSDAVRLKAFVWNDMIPLTGINSREVVQ